MAENNPRMPDLLENPDNHLIRITVRATVLGQAHLSYLYYLCTDDPTSGTALKQKAIDVWGQITPQLTDCLSEDWALVHLIVRRIDLYAAPSFFVTAAELAALTQPVVGSRGPSCPPQDAFVVRKRTNRAGKRARGRWFFSGIAEADQDGGVLTTAQQTAVTALCTAMDDFFTSTSGGSLVPFHVEWKERPPPGITTLEGAGIESCDFDPIVRSQRRRQLGHGV